MTPNEQKNVKKTPKNIKNKHGDDKEDIEQKHWNMSKETLK